LPDGTPASHPRCRGLGPSGLRPPIAIRASAAGDATSGTASFQPRARRLISTLPEDVDRLRELGAVPPLGRERCLIFAGPTGVGKTETARALAELIFGEGHLLRFDCRGFRTAETVASLLGNRAGDRGRFGQAFDAVPKAWVDDHQFVPRSQMYLAASTRPGTSPIPHVRSLPSKWARRGRVRGRDLPGAGREGRNRSRGGVRLGPRGSLHTGPHIPPTFRQGVR